jgi:hypothetical protein
LLLLTLQKTGLQLLNRLRLLPKKLLIGLVDLILLQLRANQGLVVGYRADLSGAKEIEIGAHCRPAGRVPLLRNDRIRRPNQVEASKHAGCKP